jgi:hypothetical protein
VDHNPFLKRSRAPRPDAPARGEIETPGSAANLVWQSRTAAPTTDENRLADKLEQVFADGAETLADVVRGLNARGEHAPDGASWTEASFAKELKRLGA